jgi:hypothetical protein
MSDTTFKSALRELQEDLEAARDIFVAAIASVASGPSDEIDDAVDDLLEGAEESAKAGFVIVSIETIEALRSTPYDASDDIEDALKDFNWAFQRALRELKQALVRETTS